MKSLRLVAMGVGILVSMGNSCHAQGLPAINPDPNPLALPTRAPQVQARIIQPISLAQALALALAHNLDLVRARLALEKSQSALREAQAILYPQFSLGLRYRRRESFQLTPLPNTVSVPSNLSSSQAVNEILSSSAGLNSILNRIVGDLSAQGGSTLVDQTFGGVALKYSLYTSGGRANQIQAARNQVLYKQLALETQTANLVLAVKTDYYDLQNADAQVRIRQGAVVNAQQSLYDAQALEQTGIGTRLDVISAQVELSNSLQSLTDSLSRQKIARRRLWTLLNLSQSVNLAASDPVQVAGTWNLSLEKSIVAAYQNRAELAQQLVLMGIDEADRRSDLATLGPQVALGANYNVSNDFDRASTGDRYLLRAEVNWKLFDGGAARARAAQARQAEAIVANDLAAERNLIRSSIEQVYYNLEADAQNLQTSQLAVAEAKEALRLARLSFAAGLSTQTDVIRQEQALTRAEGNQVAAVINYNISLATLQRQVGRFPSCPPPLLAAPITTELLIPGVAPQVPH